MNKSYLNKDRNIWWNVKGGILNIKPLTDDPGWSDDKDLTLIDRWYSVSPQLSHSHVQNSPAWYRPYGWVKAAWKCLWIVQDSSCRVQRKKTGRARHRTHIAIGGLYTVKYPRIVRPSRGNGGQKSLNPWEMSAINCSFSAHDNTSFLTLVCQGWCLWVMVVRRLFYAPGTHFMAQQLYFWESPVNGVWPLKDQTFPPRTGGDALLLLLGFLRSRCLISLLKWIPGGPGGLPLYPTGLYWIFTPDFQERSNNITYILLVYVLKWHWLLILR